MATCGGVITTQRIVLSDEPQQLVGADENRRRVTVFSAVYNTAPIYLMASQGIPASNGFPIDGGGGFTFEDAGAKVSIWASVARNGKPMTVFVITEGI